MKQKCNKSARSIDLSSAVRHVRVNIFGFQAERDTECITLDSYVRHFSLFLTFLLIKWNKTNLQQFLIINDIISIKNKAAFALYHFKLNIFGVFEYVTILLIV